MKSLVVALVGNPNSGKTTLFNCLTGRQQKIGNWCGVTVEKKRGWFQKGEVLVEVVDLPGCYTYLSTPCEPTTENALDEQITTEYLASQDAELIINVVDATHLERHLYLTLQLLEHDIPVIVALNMMDAASKQGINIDIEVLAKRLGCLVVPLSAVKKRGVEDLKKAILDYKTQTVERSPCFIAKGLTSNSQDEIAIAKARYELIHNILKASVRQSQTQDNKSNGTELIDKIVLNRFLGIPLFLLLMYVVFIFVIQIGGFFQDFFDVASRVVCIDGVSRWLALIDTPDWLIHIMAFGVGQGINTTVSFIPVIALMFLCLSFLEASGYMARAAFVMDKVMQWVGLPGKSFVPMIIGFGCNVPAVLAARTLENYRERILTILMSPFMSCGARLAIYALFVSAFFPVNGQNIIFGLYLIGILVALLTGFVLRTAVLSGERSTLIIELPAYRWPSLVGLGKTTWQRLKRFILKAGAMIVLLSAVMSAIGVTQDKTGMNNWLATVGRHLTPIFAPMGIKEDNWPATVGLLTGVLAKEVVVGTLNALYIQEEHRENHFLANPSEQKLNQELDKGALGIMVKRFGSLAAAFAYLLFVLLYFPCVSVVVTMARELNRSWAMFSVVWTTGIAYITAVLFYQGAIIFEEPITATAWIIGMVILLGLGFYGVRRVMQRKSPIRTQKRLPTQILVLDA